jgi:hypothetical protein
LLGEMYYKATFEAEDAPSAKMRKRLGGGDRNVLIKTLVVLLPSQ